MLLQCKLRDDRDEGREKRKRRPETYLDDGQFEKDNSAGERAVLQDGHLSAYSDQHRFCPDMSHDHQSVNFLESGHFLNPLLS
jgi:hypothetical protein